MQYLHGLQTEQTNTTKNTTQGIKKYSEDVSYLIILSAKTQTVLITVSLPLSLTLDTIPALLKLLPAFISALSADSLLALS